MLAWPALRPDPSKKAYSAHQKKRREGIAEREERREENQPRLQGFICWMLKSLTHW